MSIYDKLNAPQKEAVLTTEGPVLILAGAGSGKTRVLTHRIAYLIQEKNVNPYNILAITFTNKAAGEMKERVLKLLPGMDGEGVWVSTFHSMCVRILRRYIDRIGFDTNFTIYDTEDVKTVVKGVLKKLNIDTKRLSERTCMKVISDCKNSFISAAEYADTAADIQEKNISKVYSEYQKVLRENNALDFDDLLVKTVELFRDAPEVLENYQNRFRYIHVDEYQDTNGVQFNLVEQLAGGYGNLCVVGDDDQSIYKFRGADITNILSFEKVFKGAKVIKLEQNYRSTPSILDVANAVISHNHGRKDKRLWSDKDQGEKVKFFQYSDQREEAAEVASDIENHANYDGEQYGEIAVLYRTNAQSRSFEEACIMRNIPYKIVGGINFYHRAEIKDILGYMKTIANGRDDLAVRRIVNVPRRGIGDASVEKAAAYAEDNGMTLFEAFTVCDQIPGLSRSTKAITGFVNQIRVLRARATEGKVSELIQSIYKDVDYEAELLKLDPEQAETKRDNIRELINKAAEYDKKCEEEDIFPSLDTFLEEVALIADIDSVEDDNNRVLLMTLHGAKGLEFDRVYLCGMEEDLFPSYMSSASSDPSDIEEERRLAYVGITRARKYLTLTAAETRLQNGDIAYHRISRFVKEIPDGMMDMQVTRAKRPGLTGFSGYQGGGNRNSLNGKTGFAASGFGGYSGGGVNRQRSSMDTSGFVSKPKRGGMGSTNPGFGKDISSLYASPKIDMDFKADYVVGDRVEHPKYGAGTVELLSGTDASAMVSVNFDNEGIKKFRASMAKLKKID